MDKQHIYKRIKRNLIRKIIIVVIIIFTFMYFFDLKITGWEIQTLLYVFLIMALFTALLWFFRSTNTPIFDYINHKFRGRLIYLWYIVGALILGLVVSKLLV